MLLFKSILDTPAENLSKDDKRRAPRFSISDSFPFRCKLTLFQHNGVKLPDGKGKEWSVNLANLSTTGASVQLSLAAVAFQREPCRLKLSRGDYLLEIPANIAHFRCCSQYSLCGIVFNFPDEELKHDYLQLLEPIVIGNSLAPAAAVQDMPGRHKEQFGSNPAAQLTLWRDDPAGQIVGFNLRMHQYMIRWTDGAAELEVTGLGEPDQTGAAPPVALTETQHEEVRWLFCLAIPNLPKTVPVDVRNFFTALVG